jgi:hypothetical protein
MMTPACSGLARDQEAALRAVETQAKVLNAAIARAVDAGLIVEVSRASRYHNAQATWGDQIAPVVQPRG